MGNSEDFIIIETKEELDKLAAYIEPFEYIAYDTETTGLEKDCEIVGFSISAEVEIGYYVILAKYNSNTKSLDRCTPEFREHCAKFIQLLKKKFVIMHNAIFDVEKTLMNFKVDLLDALHTDTMLMAHLIDENNRVGLKDLAARIFGKSEVKEQEEMSKSVIANGGIWQAKNKEMYKADPHILGKYGAKDTILTLKLFYHFIPILIDENLYEFFYFHETMPLLKTAAYDLNTVGLRLDVSRLKELKKTLELEIVQLEADIHKAIYPYVKEQYPGTKAKNSFNINASQQLAWLLFIKLGNEFLFLTEGGRKKAKELLNKLPYTKNDKEIFVSELIRLGIKPQKFMKCDKATLQDLEEKYDWVSKILQLRKAEKILGTYVDGILDRSRYGIIHPAFKQHGTKGTRMSSSNPNFQNLPRDDKRVKSCIVARPGKKFIGADYSQLEPRVFTSLSKDPILLNAFREKLDPYSTLAMSVLGDNGCSAKKTDLNFYGDKYPKERQLGKEGFLSFAYGTTPFKFKQTVKLRTKIDLSMDECKNFREDYFTTMAGVDKFVKMSHLEVIRNGKVFNLFGRPRRIPQAKYMNGVDTSDFCSLPYEYRTILNLAVNSQIQMTAGSIINRASIAFCYKIKELGYNAKVVMQIHDELVIEVDENKTEEVAKILKDCMENTVHLPGVDLIAEPKIGNNLADLK